METISKTYQGRPMLSVCGPMTAEFLGELREALEGLRAWGGELFYLDLSGVATLDDTCIEFLREFAAELEGKTMELVFVHPMLMERLTASGLDQVYTVSRERRKWYRALAQMCERMALLEKRTDLYDDHIEFTRRAMVFGALGLVAVLVVFFIMIMSMPGLHSESKQGRKDPAAITQSLGS